MTTTVQSPRLSGKKKPHLGQQRNFSQLQSSEPRQVKLAGRHPHILRPMGSLRRHSLGPFLCLSMPFNPDKPSTTPACGLDQGQESVPHVTEIFKWKVFQVGPAHRAQKFASGHWRCSRCARCFFLLTAPRREQPSVELPRGSDPDKRRLFSEATDAAASQPLLYT